VLRAFGLVERRDGEVGGRVVGRARLVCDEIVGAGSDPFGLAMASTFRW
jgi:hypothetical protein